MPCLPPNHQIVGDDLLVTNPVRVAKAIKEKWCNALLLKVNHIGSVTESIDAVRMAKGAGWGVMTSHRCVRDEAVPPPAWQSHIGRVP